MENIRDYNISELVMRMEEEFSFLLSFALGEDCYIDSEPSAHMTGEREYFSSYQEGNINFQIKMGNRMKCTLVGTRTITF